MNRPHQNKNVGIRFSRIPSLFSSRFFIDFASLAVGYYSTLVKSISVANFLVPCKIRLLVLQTVVLLNFWRFDNRRGDSRIARIISKRTVAVNCNGSLALIQKGNKTDISNYSPGV